jgi:hypothetical protein
LRDKHAFIEIQPFIDRPLGRRLWQPKIARPEV